MDENLSRGYVQLGMVRGVEDSRRENENESSRSSPPVDKYKFIYFSLMLAGTGFLLPYNSFVIAVDYFQERYPGTTIIFDMSMVYIIMAFVAVIANNVLVETLSLDTRINFGYWLSFVALIFVVVCEIWWDMFGTATSYTINLIVVAVTSLSCTVQQSSFYGYTSMLPSRYTHAVMTGESIAGFLVSSNRIITKLVLENERANTALFFTISLVILFTCFETHRVVRRTNFVKFYITLCEERNRITLEPTDDVGLMDNNDPTGDSDTGRYGVLKIQTSPLGNDTATASVDATNEQCSAFSFSNPVYEPGAPSRNLTDAGGPTYKVEDVLIRCPYATTPKNKTWSGIKRGISTRLEVAKIISPYMVSIATAYFVTLCLYPGIVSEIISCKCESWMPVILMAAFNGADCLGKLLASIPYEWTRTELLYFSGIRACLIPLFLLCAIPRRAPILSDEGYPLLFALLLGLTNGIVGSVPMIQAPSKVPEEYRELTGNIMTLSYTTGLTLGSLVAYMLDACLGPPVRTKDVCPNYRNTVASMINDTAITIITGTTSTILPTIEKIATIPKFKAITTAMSAVMATTTITSDQTIGLFNAFGYFNATTSTTTTTRATTMMTNTLPKILSEIAARSNDVLPLPH